MSESPRKQHIGYVLLTNGPRHTPVPLEERPGGKSQVERIRRFAETPRHEIDIWDHDYVRSPTGPRSFPRLFALLALAQKHDASGLIILDDVTRLYRRLPAGAYLDMFEALKLYHRHIVDVRQRRLLSDLSEADWIAMLRFTSGSCSPTEVTPRLRDSESASTARARRISRIVRARTADRFARQIVDLRDELAKAGRTPTHVALARLANDRGLRTSRGNPWSDVAVGRALKRLAEEASRD